MEGKWPAMGDDRRCGRRKEKESWVAWFVGGEEVFGRPGEKDGEPAEEENQKRGGRLLLKKKRWV